MIQIQFVSDYVCPYCMLAKVPLEEACRALKTETELNYLPFELTVEPAKQVDIYHDEKRRKDWETIILPESEKLGLGMRLPHVVPRPYTRLAFEGYHYAMEQGKGAEYNSKVYQAFFVKEQDIGTIEILSAIAESCGMDGEAFKKALEEGTYSCKQREADRYAKEVLQVSHVPTVYINGREVEKVPHSSKEWKEILLQAEAVSAGTVSAGQSANAEIQAAELADNEQEEQKVQGESCGIDGCHLA